MTDPAVILDFGKVMEMPKNKEYKQLVAQRKECKNCTNYGLTNPSATDYDSYEIGAWSIWQGGLDAEVLVVGQDWGDLDSFMRTKGLDVDSNPTNRNLMVLFNSLGINLSEPSKGQKDPRVFFTNSVLCLKKGSVSASVDTQCYSNCGQAFLKPLIRLIRPKVVIALGKGAYNACASAYGLKQVDGLKEVLGQHYVIDKDIVLVPVYHCGAFGVNVNRKLVDQLEDWRLIVRLLA